MSNVGLEASCLAAGAVGATSHVLYWAHGHHDPYVTRILGLHIGSYVAILLRQISFYGAFTGFLYTAAISASYLGSLFTSMIIYRLFFHRLRHFPGPLAAKITKFYSGPCMSGSGKMHEKRKQFLSLGLPPLPVRLGTRALADNSLDLFCLPIGVENRL